MDDILLTGPTGSVLNLGSWLDAEAGPDFGEAGLLEAQYSDNPLVDGAALAFEHAGVRRMRFPLLLASRGEFNGLGGLQTWIRQMARPGGAYVDVKPHGVATADAVRFDVHTGRLVPGYRVHPWRVGRLPATLELDVQPFGYLPTLILLASTASIGVPGHLAVPGGSVLGDVPGLAKVVLKPFGGSYNSPTSYPGGSWITDMVGWSLGAQALASTRSYIAGGSVNDGIAGRLMGNWIDGGIVGDQYALGSQARAIIWSAGLDVGSQWNYALSVPYIAPFPDMRGRYRLFAYARSEPSVAFTTYWSADVETTSVGGVAAMGSIAPIATLAPPVASAAPGAAAGAWGAHPSPAYQLLDLGELSFPAFASGQDGNSAIRVFVKGATAQGAGIATFAIYCGGLYLLPVDQTAGYMPRGLAHPSIADPFVTQTVLTVDAVNNRRFTWAAPAGGEEGIAMDADRHYRGMNGLVSRDTARLDVVMGERRAGSQASWAAATTPLIRGHGQFMAASVAYRPRFLFAKGL